MVAIKRGVVVALLGAVIAGCGGGGKSTTTIPSGKTVLIQEVATCMERGGARVIKVLDEEHGAFQMLYALNPEATFNIVNLASPKFDQRMTKFMERTKANGGVPGKLVVTPVNEGWTLVGVVAAPEAQAPLPSAASEELATGCAERPTA